MTNKFTRWTSDDSGGFYSDNGEWIPSEEVDRYVILVKELIEASMPFIDSNVVDELTTTIPLMERLDNAIEALH